MTFSAFVEAVHAGGSGILLKAERRLGLASMAILVVAIACFAAALRITGPQLSWDSKDYAQCARQVERGEGFTSKLLVGDITSGVTTNGDLSGVWRNTLRTPLPVYIIAASFRLFGEDDKVVTYWSGFFYVATCWLMLTAFRPVFGFRTAFLSALVFAVSRCGLAYAQAGLTETTAMFFLVLTFALVSSQLSFTRSLIIGIVFAVSSLNRPMALVWFAAIALYIGAQKIAPGKKLVGLGGLAVGVAAALLASAALMGPASGHTAFAINLAKGVGDPEQAYASPVRFVLNNPVRFTVKYLTQLSRPLAYLFQFGAIPVFSGIAPFGLLLCLNDEQRNRRAVLLAMVLSNILVLSALTSGDAFVGPLRYFDVFAPLALPWSIQLFSHLGARCTPVPRRALWCLFVLLLTGMAYGSIRNPFPVRQHREVYADIRATLNAGETLAASGATEPPAIAWYAERRTVFLQPDFPNGLQRLRSRGLPIHWYLTMQDERAPSGFQIARQLPDGFILWRSTGAPN